MKEKNIVNPAFDWEGDSEFGSFDRRDFLKVLGGGVVVTFTVGESLAQRRSRGYPQDFNAYLRIAPDGRVTCYSGKIEMGQGIFTSLAQMLAEELDVALDRVDMVMGDTDVCPYDGGTFGSRSTKFFGPPLRRAAAEARAVLIKLAAEKLKVPEEKLKVRDGAVFVAGKKSVRITYGELAGGKPIDKHLETKPDIKHYSKHTISGKATDRTDGRLKVTGEAEFAADIRLPGMLFARVFRPPAHGAKIKKIDFSQAEKVPGARIIREKDIIAVVSDRYDTADRALALIEAEFDIPETRLNNGTIFDHLKSVAGEGNTVVEKGDISAGKAAAGKTFSLSYFNHYVAHAPSENHTAMARIEGNRATIWASTQSPFRAKGDAARALGFPQENVRVITPFVGCGFGGKNQGGQVAEAARLAQLCGKPVQVAWSRKEEFFNDTFRPAAVIDIHSGIDASKRIVYWEYHNYFAGSRSSQPFYDIPHQRVLSYGGWSGGNAHPIGVGAWRGPGSNSNVFAMESQIDIMAREAAMDPLAFRLHNLSDKRMKRVLEAAAEKFGRSFTPAPSGNGYGMACTDYLGTYLATMAEVEVNRDSGAIRVNRIVCAQDTGEVINPEGVRMQIEGCLTMGLGYCLSEEIRFRGGRILDENFDTYEIPRFSWLPKIETVLVDNPELAPQGCGEPAITSMGAVIANAVCDAIGKRLFVLPMTPDRIRTALSKK